MKQVLTLRERLLAGQGCSFVAHITADYGEQVYQFSLSCSADKNGNVNFSVLEPKTISGIAGTVAAVGGRITFEGKVLAFSLLAEGSLSPICAPWLLIKTLRSGYIRSCSKEDYGIFVSINDTYESDAMRLDIRLNEMHIPYGAEILWKGRRILTLEVEDFVIV